MDGFSHSRYYLIPHDTRYIAYWPLVLLIDSSIMQCLPAKMHILTQCCVFLTKFIMSRTYRTVSSQYPAFCFAVLVQPFPEHIWSFPYHDVPYLLPA